MKQQCRAALFGCLFCVIVLAGCAGPRKGPFDVPSDSRGGMTAPSGFSQGSDMYERTAAYEQAVRVGTRGGGSDDVNRAAAEIAAATVFFDFDTSAIRSDTRQTLDRVADLLKRNPSIRICLHGHCDARGPNEYNYALGERRARAVYGYLTGAGVPAIQLEMVTHGKASPAVSGGTENAYARNRRVELIVLTTCF